MAERDDDHNHRHLDPPGTRKPAQIGSRIGKLQIGRERQRRYLCGSPLQQGQAAPDQKHHDHHGCDLHDAKSLGTRFVNPFDVRPPEICRRSDAESGGELEPRNRRPGMQHLRYFVDHACQILAGADHTDRSRQDVIEDKSGNGEPRQERSHRVADDDINTAAHVHAAAFQIDGTHGKAEQHDRENEPWRAFTDRVLGNTAGVKRRRSQIAQYDRGSAPEGDKREHHRARNDDPGHGRRLIVGQVAILRITGSLQNHY